MRTGKILLLAVVLTLLFGVAAEADARYIVRFAGASIHPTGDLSVDDTERLPLGDGTTMVATTRAMVEADSAFGFCIDFERRFNDLFGLGFTIMQSDHDLDASGSSVVRITDDATGAVLLDITESLTMPLGSVDVTPLLMSANFHFGGSDKVDLYAGPFVGMIDFGDLTFEGDRVGFKDEFAYGATFGLDVPFGQGSAAFSASARYMIAGAQTDEPDPDTLDLDPVVVLFGLGYRF